MQRGAARAVSAKARCSCCRGGDLSIDVFLGHLAAETYVQNAANTVGAAAVRGARKVEKYACGQAGVGHDFEPVIVERYRRLGEPAFELLARLARIAAALSNEAERWTRASWLKSLKDERGAVPRRWQHFSG